MIEGGYLPFGLGRASRSPESIPCYKLCLDSMNKMLSSFVSSLAFDLRTECQRNAPHNETKNTCDLLGIPVGFPRIPGSMDFKRVDQTLIAT
jgi:hypothetical protein